MSSPPTSVGGSGLDRRDDVRYVIDVLRGIVEEEFKFTERLSATARQAFALAAAFVALAQSVAFGSFKVDLVTRGERTAMVVCAAVAILLVARSAFAAAKVDRFVPDRSLDDEEIIKYLGELYEPQGEALVEGRADQLRDASENMVVKLANDHLAVVKARRDANAERGRAVRAVRLWVGLALAATSIELMVALVARI